jgi:hypothetical protein
MGERTHSQPRWRRQLTALEPQSVSAAKQTREQAKRTSACLKSDITGCV